MEEFVIMEEFVGNEVIEPEPGEKQPVAFSVTEGNTYHDDVIVFTVSSGDTSIDKAIESLGGDEYLDSWTNSASGVPESIARAMAEKKASLLSDSKILEQVLKLAEQKKELEEEIKAKSLELTEELSDDKNLEQLLELEEQKKELEAKSQELTDRFEVLVPYAPEI